MSKKNKISSELSPENYTRVAIINLWMSIPLFGLFSWIGFSLCYYLSASLWLSLSFTTFFAFPMMLTLLHGHVTIAIGVTQRDHYYTWLAEKGNRLGILFHSHFISTRFRITGLIVYAIAIVLLFLLQ